MPRFRIFTYVRAFHDGIKYFHYAVNVFNQSINNWVFIKSFLSLEHAEDFICQLKNQFKKGDYSCLTLRT